MFVLQLLLLNCCSLRAHLKGFTFLSETQLRADGSRDLCSNFLTQMDKLVFELRVRPSWRFGWFFAFLVNFLFYLVHTNLKCVYIRTYFIHSCCYFLLVFLSLEVMTKSH